MSGVLNLLLAGAASAIKDAYFNLTTLLLNTSSTNGAQNNTFLDSSTNNFTITRNGNTTQGTFTPFSQTGWSNYFSTGPFLSVASNTAFDFGSGDATQEMWIYPTTTSQNAGLIDKRSIGANYSQFPQIAIESGVLKVYVSYTGSSWAAQITGATPTPNAWTHIALVRSGNTWTLYVNGVVSGTPVVASGSVYASTSGLCIGAAATDGSNAFTGYISNVRIVKGTAVYTSAFTPPTTPLTAISGTSLLTCQSNRFADSSSNNFAITVNGSPSVQAFSPFLPTAAYDTAVVGGSGYFDGSGDYLTCSVSASPTGTQNFTIEGWVYVPSAATEYAILANNNSSGGFYLRVNSSGQINVVHTNIAGIIVSSSSVKANSWNYFCVTRSGNTFNIYLNSTSVDATTSNSVSFATGTSTVVGADYAGGVNFRSYMSSLRVVIGTATAPSAVPTAPFTAITNTSLLLNFTNAGIYDSASKNVLETVGDAQVSTTVAKWGTTSMKFDGTGDALKAPYTPNMDFGTGDFTIECWVYTTNVSPGYSQTVLARHGSSGGTIWIVQILDGGTSRINLAGSVNCAGTTVAANTWTHLAFTRSGTSLRAFNNGVLITTVTDSTSLSGTQVLTVGAQSDIAAPFIGYIDDVRITKGFARYTATFTPPTAAFPLQ